MEDWRKRVAALEATGKLVGRKGRDTQLRLRWMRQTDLTQLRMLLRRQANLSCATEESRNPGRFGGDRQPCPVRLKKAATPDALGATDELVLRDRREPRLRML